MLPASHVAIRVFDATVLCQCKAHVAQRAESGTAAAGTPPVPAVAVPLGRYVSLSRNRLGPT